MKTARQGRRSVFVVIVGLAIGIGLIAQTSIAPASTIPCLGDCAGDDRVTVDDLIKGVNIALGTAAVSTCPPFDLANDGSVTVDELVKAVNKALSGCFESVALPNLPAGVEVVYDSIGIPHIYGPDLDSVAYVQGYLHAAHRFWQMDTFRRVEEGRLSELFGAVTLTTDVAMRTTFTNRDGRRLEEAIWEHLQATEPEISAAVENYADGVNAWLADLRAGRNGAVMPPEYGLFLINQGPKDLADWRPQDCAAVGRLTQWNGLDSLIYNAELGRATAWQEWPEAVRKDLLRSAPLSQVPVVPPPDTMMPLQRRAAPIPPALPDVAILDDLQRLLEEVARYNPLGKPAEGAGSNNWVVAPELSANGFAMLASDPHLGLTNPGIWFLVQIDIGGDTPTRATGYSLAGLPGILGGFNDMGAWGGTYTFFDVLDIYTETVTTPPDYPASPRTVLFNGEQVPVLRIEEEFRMNGGAVVTYPIEIVPHHGPMLPDPNLEDAVVGLAATGMTLRWTGHEISNDFRTFLELMRARNAEEFRAVFRNGVQAASLNNYVWADVHGDIAYTTYGRLPQRPAGTEPYLPMPGTGEAEWLTDGEGNILWLPEEKFPQALNPPDGFIATANSDQFGYTFDGDPLNDGVYLAFTYAPGLREQRIQDLLTNQAGVRAEGAKITMADMSAYQHDTASLEACRAVPFLLEAAENRPDLVTAEMSDALDRLRAWAGEKPESPACHCVSGIDAHELRDDVPPRQQPVSDEERADSIASSIYAGWVTRAFRALVPSYAVDAFRQTGESGSKPFLHMLEDVERTEPGYQVYTMGPDGQSTLWDNPETPEVEIRDEVLLLALRDGIDYLAQKFGSRNFDDWLWGKVHRARLQHFLGQAGIPSLDLGPFAAPGGRLTVNVANYNLFLDNFELTGGPSQRLVVVLDPSGIKAVNSLPGGQNANPGSLASYTKINPAIHYGDLIPGWLNGETFEYRITRQAVAADNQRHVQYLPAGS